MGVVERLRRRLPAAPAGHTWIGDDAAVVDDGWLLAVDSVVAGVHAPEGTSLRELGYRAVVRNVSDIAAMAGRPQYLLVALVGVAGADVDSLFDGIEAAAARYGCGVVGGDLASGPGPSVTVTVTGRCRPGVGPVLRSGARPGDSLWVTGPLGGAAASGYTAQPSARVEEGEAAARAGATAMIDISDGLAVDARRLAEASGVGVTIDRASIPVARGATLDQAMGGGDDYELLYTLPPGAAGPGVRIGACSADPTELPPVRGWVHGL